MKKFIFSAFVLFAFSSAAFAQNTANDNVAVSVNLVPALTIAQSQDLAFGNVARGATSPAMSATDGSLTAGLSTGTRSVGRLTVTGAPGEAVNITSSSSINLAGPSSSSITFTPAFAHSTSETSGYASGTSFTFSGTQGGTTAATHYIQVGGALDISGATSSGSHTGTLTVTVTYASL